MTFESMEDGLPGKVLPDDDDLPPARIAQIIAGHCPSLDQTTREKLAAALLAYVYEVRQETEDACLTDY